MLDNLFKLKKSKWNVRFMNFMMKWIWNFNPEDFAWGCPYFWLTILNIIIFIPFSIIKLPILGIKKLVEILIGHIEKTREKRYNKLLNELMTKPDAQDRFARSNKLWSFMNWLDERFFADNEKYAGLYYSLRDKYYSKQSQVASTAKSNKERINMLLKVAKPVGIAVIWIVSFFAAWLILWICWKIGIALSHIPHKTWVAFWQGVLIFGVGVIIILAIVFIVMSVQATTAYTKSVNAAGDSFKSVGRGIKKAFLFVKGILHDACPKIQWED